LRFAFARPDMREWRLGKHAIGHQTVARAAVGASEIGLDPTVVSPAAKSIS
jgi:hypothetical protein